MSSLIGSYCLVISAEEQSQQRLQAEEAEQQYQTLVHKLNITTKRSQRRESVSPYLAINGLRSLKRFDVER